MSTVKIGILAALMFGMATLVGCESPWPMGPSLVAQYMGDAHRENTARMTENPYAGHENTEAPTVDAENAEVVLDRYYSSQAKDQTQRDMPSIIQIDAN
jgi:hypothetical protein